MGEYGKVEAAMGKWCVYKASAHGHDSESVGCATNKKGAIAIAKRSAGRKRLTSDEKTGGFVNARGSSGSRDGVYFYWSDGSRDDD